MPVAVRKRITNCGGGHVAGKTHEKDSRKGLTNTSQYHDVLGTIANSHRRMPPIELAKVVLLDTLSRGWGECFVAVYFLLPLASLFFSPLFYL